MTYRHVSYIARAIFRGAKNLFFLKIRLNFHVRTHMCVYLGTRRIVVNRFSRGLVYSLGAQGEERADAFAEITELWERIHAAA